MNRLASEIAEKVSCWDLLIYLYKFRSCWSSFFDVGQHAWSSCDQVPVYVSDGDVLGNVNVSIFVNLRRKVF